MLLGGSPAGGQAPPGEVEVAGVPLAVSAVRGAYNLYIGGSRFLEGRAELSFDGVGDGSGYAMEMSVETVGLLAMISGWRYDIAAAGRVEDGTGDRIVAPDRYVSTRTRKDNVRRRILTFASDGTVETADDPPRDDPPELPPEELLLGTIDPLSAAVWISALLHGQGHCNATLPVYDGRRRYDLVVRGGVTRSLSVSGVEGYEGPAQLCSARLELLAGEFADEDDSGDERLRSMDFYFARPVEGGPLLPVRAEGESQFGAIRLHLSSASRSD